MRTTAGINAASPDGTERPRPEPGTEPGPGAEPGTEPGPGAEPEAEPGPGTGPTTEPGREPGRDLAPLLAGAATGIAGAGAVLALTGDGSPLRGPFTLFFLLAAPAAAVAALLRGLDPFGRALASLAAAVVVDMLVAQVMLAVHRWSVRGGVVAVTVLSSAVLAAVFVRRMRKVRSRGLTASVKVD